MILSVLFIAFMFVPGELRQGEVDSSIKSASLSLKSLSPDMVVDLPYHVLQRFSINLFGSTTAAIKLPSLVLALLTAIGFFFLVKTMVSEQCRDLRHHACDDRHTVYLLVAGWYLVYYV
jgi:hypothetical protein